MSIKRRAPSFSTGASGMRRSASAVSRSCPARAWSRSLGPEAWRFPPTEPSLRWIGRLLQPTIAYTQGHPTEDRRWRWRQRRRGSRESSSIATRKSVERRRAPPGSDRVIIKPLRRLPLGSLRVFVSVAQHLNFTRAADALGVTASAASLQIRTLEEYLARSLFRRNGRQVHLTNEGASLLPRVQHALAELERAVDDVRGDRLAGPLRVTTLPSFLQLWLLPRIARFRADHPEIDLHIHTSADMVALWKEDFQLAIRLGLGGLPNLWAEKRLDEWLLPVCSPALYAQHGPARTTADLKACLLFHGVSDPWTAWLFDGHAVHYACGLHAA